MSALRISSEYSLGMFKISIILKIISLTSGAFIHAPVVFLFNPLIIFGYSIIVKIISRRISNTISTRDR